MSVAGIIYRIFIHVNKYDLIENILSYKIHTEQILSKFSLFLFILSGAHKENEFFQSWKIFYIGGHARLWLSST